MTKKLATVIPLTIFASLIASCLLIGDRDRESPVLKIEECLDTIYIYKEQQHGFYDVNDTLALFSGWPLMDESKCYQFEYRSEPLWSPSDKPYRCTISDLYPPFHVFKRCNSDTIFILKDKIIYRYIMKNEES